MTTVSDGLFQYGGVPVPVAFTGKAYFVDPVNGSDQNSGTKINQAFQTIYKGHAACTAGNNDTVYLIGNGAASGSARLSIANAQSVNSAATGGALLWTKNATHLIGICAAGNNNRARMAPPTGTYTAATFVDTTMVNVTATGCVFRNLSVYAGFSTGAAAFIAWTENGGRNQYDNCQFQGMNDAVSAQDAGSRSLKVMGTTGENVFNNCVIGDDTTTRTVANANLEFAGGVPRNTFNNCIFPIVNSSASVLAILGTGASCIDRWQKFDRCSFINDIKSGSTTMTVMISMTNASPGGLLLLKDCDQIGATNWADTNGKAVTYVSGPAVSSSMGVDVNPA